MKWKYNSNFAAPVSVATGLGPDKGKKSNKQRIDGHYDVSY